MNLDSVSYRLLMRTVWAVYKIPKYASKDMCCKMSVDLVPMTAALYVMV